MIENRDGSFVAVFAFDEIDLTTEPSILGSRPIVLVSQGDFRVDADLDGSGGKGSRIVQGQGVVGGGMEVMPIARKRLEFLSMAKAPEGASETVQEAMTAVPAEVALAVLVAKGPVQEERFMETSF